MHEVVHDDTVPTEVLETDDKHDRSATRSEEQTRKWLKKQAQLEVAFDEGSVGQPAADLEQIQNSGLIPMQPRRDCNELKPYHQRVQGRSAILSVREWACPDLSELESYTSESQQEAELD